MTREKMKSHATAYANRILKVCSAWPDNGFAQTLVKQLLRRGTSVEANDRAICCVKSNFDFVNKLRLVEEECDESLFGMELWTDNNFIKLSRLGRLRKEADENLAMVVSSASTARTSRST